MFSQALLSGHVSLGAALPRRYVECGRHAHRYFRKGRLFLRAAGAAEGDETAFEYLNPIPRPLTERLPDGGDEFFDAMNALLTVDDAERLSSREALRTPWVAAATSIKVPRYDPMVAEPADAAELAAPPKEQKRRRSVGDVPICADVPIAPPPIPPPPAKAKSAGAALPPAAAPAVPAAPAAPSPPPPPPPAAAASRGGAAPSPRTSGAAPSPPTAGGLPAVTSAPAAPAASAPSPVPQSVAPHHPSLMPSVGPSVGSSAAASLPSSRPASMPGSPAEPRLAERHRGSGSGLAMPQTLPVDVSPVDVSDEDTSRAEAEAQSASDTCSFQEGSFLDSTKHSPGPPTTRGPLEAAPPGKVTPPHFRAEIGAERRATVERRESHDQSLLMAAIEGALGGEGMAAVNGEAADEGGAPRLWDKRLSSGMRRPYSPNGSSIVSSLSASNAGSRGGSRGGSRCGSSRASPAPMEQQLREREREHLAGRRPESSADLPSAPMEGLLQGRVDFARDLHPSRDVASPHAVPASALSPAPSGAPAGSSPAPPAPGHTASALGLPAVSSGSCAGANSLGCSVADWAVAERPPPPPSAAERPPMPGTLRASLSGSVGGSGAGSAHGSGWSTPNYEGGGSHHSSGRLSNPEPLGSGALPSPSGGGGKFEKETSPRPPLEAGT